MEEEEFIFNGFSIQIICVGRLLIQQMP